MPPRARPLRLRRLPVRLFPLTLLPVAVLFLAAGLSPSGAARPSPAQVPTTQVIVTPNAVPFSPDHPFLGYALTNGDLHAELFLDPAKPPRRTQLLFTVWRGAATFNPAAGFAPDRSIPIGIRMQLFRPLFEKLLQTRKPEDAYDLTVYSYSELYDRLASLALADPGWNRRTGSPVHASPGYGYLENLLTKGQAFHELSDTAALFHYQVSLTGQLEQLIVVRGAQLSPDQKAHIAAVFKPTDLIPVRLSVTFLLHKEI